MQAFFILSAVRTPIGKYGGSLGDFSAADRGAIAARAALERARVAAEEIQEVICGQAHQAGSGPNVARQIAGRAEEQAHLRLGKKLTLSLARVNLRHTKVDQSFGGGHHG